jgi:hypothetical protein
LDNNADWLVLDGVTTYLPMHFLKKISRIHLILIASAVLFLFVFFSTFATLRWMQNEHMGTIISLNESSFTITNPRNETHTFSLTSDTHIYKGRTKETHLEIGNTVLVVCSKDSSGILTANIVRILKPQKKPSSQQSGEGSQAEMQPL